MKVLTTRARYGLSMLLAGLAAWLILSGLPVSRANTSVAASRPRTQKQSGSSLSTERQAALEKLFAQLKAGGLFSEEETIILNRFGSGGALSDLEADVVISRALYDFYISGKELTKQQHELFDNYSLFVSRRSTDLADLKTQLLNKRKAAAAVAPPRTTPLVAPANDLCAGAQVIPGAGPFPHLTTTVDILDATTTGDPPLPSCQADVSRSVWYTFTPTASSTYNISSCADAPTSTTVDDTVIAIYTATGCGGPFTEIVTSGTSDGCDDDSCVTESLQAFVLTTLTAGTQYFIVVYEFDATAPTAGNTSLQLRVTQFPAPANDLCTSATTLTVNTPVTGTTMNSFNDYQLSGAACFPPPNNTASTAVGRDVTYTFTAPTTGFYSFRVTNYSTASQLVLYVASMCEVGPSPVTVTSCLSAANRQANNSAEEVMCLSLASGTQVFIFVDENTFTAGSTFTIEATRCVQEAEPNGTPASANALTFGVEGSITPAGEADFYSLGTHPAGSRVFALVDGVAANSTDFDLRVTTTVDTLEYDDLNADTPFGSVSATVAGTPLTAAAAFLRVSFFSAGVEARPYRLYATVQPPIASAITETEPNNTIAQANSNPANYFTGSLAGPAPSTDVDVFSFTATAGDLVFLSLDGDPLRNATPINPMLELLDSSGGVLLVVNDGSSTSSTTSGAGSLTATTPFSTAESIVLKATTTGTFFARVTIGTTSTTSTGAGDYLLSIVSIPSGPTAVRFGDYDARNQVKASRYANGALLQWRTGYELDNLGFNVYREAGGKRAQINPSLLAGSAFMVGSSVAMTAGKPYAWWDDNPQHDCKYWVEAIGLDGKSDWQGPIEVDSSNAAKSLPVSEQVKSILLSRLTAQQQQIMGDSSSSPVERKARPVSANGAHQSIQAPITGQPGVKLSVIAEGWYRVTQPELVAAGLDPSIDPRRLQLHVDGKQEPMIVTGEGDGSFNISDAIEFYGMGVDSAYTRSRVYWVVLGAQPGLRIQVNDGKGGAGSAKSFPYTVERRDKLIYFSSLKNGDAENFFGQVLATNPVNQVLTLQHVDGQPPGGALLSVSLQGASTQPHRVNIQLNGADVGELSFNGQAQGLANITLPQSQLREGDNTVTLQPLNGSGDVSLVHYVRITYWHSYAADSNVLRFAATGGQSITVDGFTNPQIRLMDITNPSLVQQVGGTINQQNGSYAMSFAVAGSGQRTLLAYTAEQARRPVAVVVDQPSMLRLPNNGADEIIITRRELFDSMQPLKSLRQSQGLSVAVVDVEDIYDEFSFGQKSSRAIKDFLEYATSSWKRPPQFVLLAADASLDPNNYFGQGDFDLVPSKTLDTYYMETVSDDWLVDFNSDGAPDLAVGRLPVRTAQEASKLVGKIVRYEQYGRPEGVTLVSDLNDGIDFSSSSNGLKAFILDDIRVTDIVRGPDASIARSQLIESINNGASLVNYIGHASVDIWRGNLLLATDAGSLTNTENLSTFVMMSCLNGYYQDVALPSLAESLLSSDGGAVAVWASSGMTEPIGQMQLNREFYRLVFGERMTLGQAAAGAKLVVGDPDVRRTWILFGDPATRLK